MAPVEDDDGAVRRGVVQVLLYRHRVGDGVMCVYDALLRCADLGAYFDPLPDAELLLRRHLLAKGCRLCNRHSPRQGGYTAGAGRQPPAPRPKTA